MFFSTLVLDRYDLQEKSKAKEVKDLVPADFNSKIQNLIKAVKIVAFNEFAKEGAEPIKTIIFKSDCTLKGEVI